MAGKSGLQPLFKPLLPLHVLTLGAVAVAAGTVGPVELAAIRTLIAGEPVGFGPAFDDRPDDFPVLVGNALSVAFQVLGAEGLKDLSDLSHGTSLP